MYKALQPRDDFDRLYASKERRGIAGIKDSVDASIQRLEDYIQKREGRLIPATGNNTDNTITKKWEEKQLH